MDAAIGLPAKNNLLSRIYHGSCCLSADRQHTYFATNIQYFAYIDNISKYFAFFRIFVTILVRYYNEQRGDMILSMHGFERFDIYICTKNRQKK
jgi:hypothetical protein